MPWIKKIEARAKRKVLEGLIEKIKTLKTFYGWEKRWMEKIIVEKIEKEITDQLKELGEK